MQPNSQNLKKLHAVGRISKKIISIIFYTEKLQINFCLFHYYKTLKYPDKTLHQKPSDIIRVENKSKKTNTLKFS